MKATVNQKENERNDFIQAFGDFINQRSVTAVKKLYQDPKFINLIEKRSKLFKEYILSKVPFKEYNEYEEIKAIIEEIISERIYMQGFRDGFNFAQLLESGQLNTMEVSINDGN
ncbi:MAG TPA: hypothetical protein DCE09_02650 [Thermoanaerobacter sp.]|nr:hypothetical protein [Thermoanaerobacter sp.]